MPLSIASVEACLEVLVRLLNTAAVFRVSSNNLICTLLGFCAACGREYTIVATHAYDGPSEEEALKILERRRRRDEAERQRQEAIVRAKEEELRLLREEEKERKKIRYLTSKRLCSMDPRCPGFTYESGQPSICRECGFSVVYHTIVVDEHDDKGEDLVQPE